MKSKRRRTALAVGVVALGLASGGVISPTVRYPSPIEIAVSPDGARLYVVCEGTDELLALDARSGAILRRIAVGRVPKSVALSPDGKRVWVANSWGDSFSEVDTGSL